MSAVGDTVHAMPVVASLRRAWPETHITWVIQPGPGNLMQQHPDVDAFAYFHRDRGIKGYTGLWRRMRGHAFDVVINLHPVFKGGLVTRLLPAAERLGFDRDRALDYSWLATNRTLEPRPVAHAQDEMFEFLDHLGVPTVRRWDFGFTEEETAARHAWRERFDRPVLGVVLRSSRPYKDWTLEGYGRVIDHARHDLGLDVVLLGGANPGEWTEARRLLADRAGGPHLELGGTLKELAGKLAECDLVVSPDTGPLHMAVALGTPTVGLYGATDPKRSGPYERFHDLLIDRYSEPREKVPSRERREGNMLKIEVGDVVTNIERGLRRYVRGAV